MHHRQYEGLRGTVDGGRAKVVMHNVKTAVSTKKKIAGGVLMNPGTFYVPVVYWGSPPAAPLQTSEPPPPLPPPESPLRGPGAGAKQQQLCDEPILAMDTLKARIMGAAPEDVKAIIAGVQFVPRCGRGGVRGTMKGAQAAGAGCRQVCSHSLCAGACIDTFPLLTACLCRAAAFTSLIQMVGGRAALQKAVTSLSCAWLSHMLPLHTWCFSCAFCVPLQAAKSKQPQKAVEVFESMSAVNVKVRQLQSAPIPHHCCWLLLGSNSSVAC